MSRHQELWKNRKGSGCFVPWNTRPMQHTATHYNTVQHAAAHCTTLQHALAFCNTLRVRSTLPFVCFPPPPPSICFDIFPIHTSLLYMNISHSYIDSSIYQQNFWAYFTHTFFCVFVYACVGESVCEVDTEESVWSRHRRECVKSTQKKVK